MDNFKFLTIAFLASVFTTGCATYDKAKNKVSGLWKDPISVTVTNLTDNVYLTPILVVGHGERDSAMFTEGQAASKALQAVAEGGSLSLMIAKFDGEQQVIVNPADGLLGPGNSVSFELDESAQRFSLIAKILPTNDGFVAVDNAAVERGSINLFAYDAGTEANDESITGGGAPNTPGIPADPTGLGDALATGISGVTAEGIVQKHAGIQGGEGSAFTVANNAWSGPIATVTITKEE